jgi:hypothetical protein
MISLPPAHTETERRPCFCNRHPEEESDRRSRRGRIINRRRIIVPLHDNRTIMTLYINRPRRRMVVNPMLAVAVGVTSMMPAAVTC